MLADARVGIELDAAHAYLLGIGQIAAQHADAGIRHLRLEVVNGRVVEREVGDDAAERLGLHPDLELRVSSGLTTAAESTGRPSGIGRQAVQVETDRLEAGRIGGVRVDRLGQAVRRRQLSREVGVVDVGLSRPAAPAPTASARSTPGSVVCRPP